MSYQLTEVLFLMNVKPVPQVTTQNNAPESEIFHYTHIIEINTPKGIYVTVDESLTRSRCQLLHREVGFFVGLTLAVEDVFQEYIL